MPLPKPTDDENRRQFIQRCIADPVANAEFPDAAQRLAVCVDLWSDEQ